MPIELGTSALPIMLVSRFHVPMRLTRAADWAPGDCRQPQQLAAILAATLDERVRPNAYVAYTCSDAVLEALDEFSGRAESLEEVQFDYGVSIHSGTRTQG